MTPAARVEAEPFTVENGVRIEGESIGEGPPIVLLHGITATRRYVLHGSKVLPRAGFQTITYDARGHGRSGAAPADEGYGFPQMAADLDRVLEATIGDRPFVLGGHSMGSHTVVHYALTKRKRIAGLVVIGPVSTGAPNPEALAQWDRLADGLDRAGVDGFMEAYAEQDADPAWRDRIMAFTRERIEQHADLGALADAIRQVPRSRPIGSMDDLEAIEIPTLVVASHDEADPGHPWAVAAEYAKAIPGAQMISEAGGESPLAWSGGYLSRELETFIRTDRVADRLS